MITTSIYGMRVFQGQIQHVRDLSMDFDPATRRAFWCGEALIQRSSVASSSLSFTMIYVTIHYFDCSIFRKQTAIQITRWPQNHRDSIRFPSSGLPINWYQRVAIETWGAGNPVGPCPPTWSSASTRHLAPKISHSDGKSLFLPSGYD